MGNCCTKSQSSIQAAYQIPDRLHYPMKRTNPKGEESLAAYLVDEAMQSIVTTS